MTIDEYIEDVKHLLKIKQDISEETAGDLIADYPEVIQRGHDLGFQPNWAAERIIENDE